MNDYANLCSFMYEKIDEIIRKMEEEVIRTENLKLKRYLLNMRRMCLDMEELELDMRNPDNSPDSKAIYFRIFNLVTKMIQKMDADQELFLVKQHMLALQRAQIEAEELYLGLAEEE